MKYLHIVNSVDHVHAHIRINFRKTTPLRYHFPTIAYPAIKVN